nr:glycoside hydrolase family protein [Campylobacter sp.]
MRDEFINEIKFNEGFSSKIYECSVGKDTIGYGFKVDCLSSDEIALNGGKVEPMPKENADKILNLKLKKLEKEAFEVFDWLENAPLKVQECVIEMCYQMGIPGVKKFNHTLHYMRTAQYQKAYENGLKSLWAKQTPKRAKRVLGKLLADL